MYILRTSSQMASSLGLTRKGVVSQSAKVAEQLFKGAPEHGDRPQLAERESEREREREREKTNTKLDEAERQPQTLKEDHQ